MTTAHAPSRGAPAKAAHLGWYALAVHVRSEAKAAGELRTRLAVPSSGPGIDGDDVFVPIRVERRAWSDRVKRVEVPLFPGYVFVRTMLDAERRVELLRAKPVIDVVGRVPGMLGDGQVARMIPDGEIEALRLVVHSERAMDPIERLVRGRHVLVAAGPLRGARGVVDEGPDGKRRLVVQIALLGRGVRTVLTADDVVEACEESASGIA